MSKTCLVVLIGLPCAGKTTFSKIISRKLSMEKDFFCYAIHYDDVIKEMLDKGVELRKYFKDIRNSAFISVETTVKENFNKTGKHVVVIDDNMYYKSMRYQYYKLAKKYKTSFLQVYIELNTNLALERNKRRPIEDQIPESIIMEMQNKIEKPGHEKWEKNSIHFDSFNILENNAFIIFLQALKKSMEEPIHYPNEEKPHSQTSHLQKIDLLLRKIVNKKIKDDIPNTQKHLHTKRQLFKNIKEGTILIDEDLNELLLHEMLLNLYETVT